MSQAPLTPGGVLQNPRSAPLMFSTRTPPVVRDNTYIVAAAHPTSFLADPTKDGWFLSDLFAINYLFKGLGAGQVWLTAVEPRKLVEKYGNYVHGNPYRDRKVVLSHQLLDDGELSPVTVVRNTDIIGRFLYEVRKASEKAHREGGNILLLIFCHGTSGHVLELDPGKKGAGLTTVQLREAIGTYVPTTLITTSCFSGGWTASQDLNITSLTAAGADTESVAWPHSESIGRASGCMFVSSVIEILTETSSPLLDESEKSNLTSNDTSLQPESANEQQTETYNEFCRTIWKTCTERLHRPFEDQEFSFSAQDDEWEFSWTGRTGIPLSAFKKRWDALATSPYTGSMEKKELRDPSPFNPYFFPDDTSRPQTASSGTTMQDDSTHGENLKSTREYRLVRILESFLQTCPGQWHLGKERPLRVFLEGCIKARAPRLLVDEDCREDDDDIWQPENALKVVRFRVSLAAMADYFVGYFELPLPNGQTCLAWNKNDWYREKKIALGPARFGEFLKKRDIIFRKLTNEGFNITPRPDQGPPFYHVDRYLTAALVGANKTQEETVRIIRRIVAFMDAGRKFYLQLACEQAETKRKGRDWLKSLGRRVRKSLSPTKKSKYSVGEASASSPRPGSSSLFESMGRLSMSPGRGARRSLGGEDLRGAPSGRPGHK